MLQPTQRTLDGGSGGDDDVEVVVTRWRVMMTWTSGLGDQIDRVTRSIFGFGRKSPPEKFSGGGERRWWPESGGLRWGRWPDMGEVERDVYNNDEFMEASKAYHDLTWRLYESLECIKGLKRREYDSLHAGTMAEVDIDTLTIEQYLALSQENPASSVVKPKIGGNVNFEIKSQFMRELREDHYLRGKKTRMLPGAAKRWVDRLAPGTINTWDLLKKAFIQRYYLPSMTAKELEDIHNFKQDGNKHNNQGWE
ncbi:putative reverse transcriptase domain-containing protein [Tanacetum coccineum]